ncbi:hypothetical protein UCRPA7_8752 [Phaeoacremonium minimum UCRPA7]|uniref:Uncharacterized protein n=1 Tax=Phaeoacremonium minimum (strain UCR-PA7) TaxID=1286976 RepID=R8B903_PHAM7|nr:hypothetical protein UCRPA7_8752 [Phaeoacremonium minimum UCRPA7]EON95763.1 hypothetical protein UCRPA7_8752 [Phaeoacremonium minimum UCRPA7]
MNGTQPPKDPAAAAAQQAASNTNANGSSTAINKKRKKDGLKPIITTENPQGEPAVFRGIQITQRKILSPIAAAPASLRVVGHQT